MDVFNVSTDLLFPISSTQNAQKEQYALRHLEQGLQDYTTGDYDKAVSSFKLAIGLAPQAGSAINAYDYIAKARLQQGDTQAAVDAYKALLRTDPSRDTARISLGNLYYAEGRFDEASDEYGQAVKLNPSSINRYSLGQSYLATGRADAALGQFTLIDQQEPTQPQGVFGMGQAYAKLGRHDEAIGAFKEALSIQDDYWDAYLEMGYVYADSGETDLADEMVTKLEGNDDTLASLLSQYIYEKTKPQLMAMLPNSALPGFVTTLGPRTEVADLGSYLTNAGDEHTFALNFIFSKAMDRQSVENVFNWNISRALGTGKGDDYNYGLAVPDTEISLATNPAAVYYDSDGYTATVLFTVRQNATADGTIDPSHINFRFSGVDEFGLAMDSTADAYSGFSGVA